MSRFPLLALITAVACGAAPRIVYTKDFPGSVPAWVGITVEHSGETVYKEEVNDPYPIKFKLRGDETAELFRLAGKLDKFTRPLESNLKVAKMGIKTFRFEDGSNANEQKFNYSLDEDAKSLADWFEKIIESEQHMIRLERTVKYDRLGVNDALLRLQVTLERKRLTGAEQFLPLLDRVIKNDSYLHMARERASQIADAIRTPQAAKPE